MYLADRVARELRKVTEALHYFGGGEAGAQLRLESERLDCLLAVILGVRNAKGSQLRTLQRVLMQLVEALGQSRVGRQRQQWSFSYHQCKVDIEAHGEVVGVTGSAGRLNLTLNDVHQLGYFLEIVLARWSIDTYLYESWVGASESVVDVGANVGFLTWFYSMTGVSRVYAFEPVPEVYRLKHADPKRIKFYQYCVGEMAGNVRLYKSSTHLQGNTTEITMVRRFPTVFGANLSSIKCPSIAYDDLFKDIYVDFIKVDIEGSETAFLSGARTALGNGNIGAVQIEVYDEAYEDVVPCLCENFGGGYVVVESRDGELGLYPIHADLAVSELVYVTRATPPTYFFSRNMPRSLSNPASVNRRRRSGGEMPESSV